jgi:hypothetical protein
MQVAEKSDWKGLRVAQNGAVGHITVGELKLKNSTKFPTQRNICYTSDGKL